MPSNVVTPLDPQSYYRMPWSLSDNGIFWLEITSQCNLTCEGCYHENIPGGHKSLADIEEEFKVIKRLRKVDSVSIAGGDPLLHPQITDIVRMVRKYGWKPIMNTNGLALTPELLANLKKAGVFGFTFHVDTSQKRRDSHADTEQEHVAIRQQLAELVAREGGMVCGFNQTVSEQTLEQIPGIVRWAERYPDIINTMVFILFRTPGMSANFDFFARGKKVSLYGTYIKTSWGGIKNLKAQDVVAKIRETDPDYKPSGYLNGTVEAEAMKWTLATRIANKKRTFGYTSPRFMEFVQIFHHRFYGTWLSYAAPSLLHAGRSTLLALGWMDKQMRKTLLRFLLDPSAWFGRVYLQNFAIIQPVDLLADGRMNMCDGCPDITVHEGQLYWSCRLEEIKKFGTFVTAVPKSGQPEEEEKEVRCRTHRGP
jgi:hypothetical protein